MKTEADSIPVASAQSELSVPYECPAHLATRSPSGVLIIHPKVILKYFPDPSETMIMWSLSLIAVRTSCFCEGMLAFYSDYGGILRDDL